MTQRTKSFVHILYIFFAYFSISYTLLLFIRKEIVIVFWIYLFLLRWKYEIMPFFPDDALFRQSLPLGIFYFLIKVFADTSLHIFYSILDFLFFIFAPIFFIFGRVINIQEAFSDLLSTLKNFVLYFQFYQKPKYFSLLFYSVFALIFFEVRKDKFQQGFTQYGKIHSRRIFFVFLSIAKTVFVVFIFRTIMGLGGLEPIILSQKDVLHEYFKIYLIFCSVIFQFHFRKFVPAFFLYFLASYSSGYFAISSLAFFMMLNYFFANPFFFILSVFFDALLIFSSPFPELSFRYLVLFFIFFEFFKVLAYNTAFPVPNFVRYLFESVLFFFLIFISNLVSEPFPYSLFKSISETKKLSFIIFIYLFVFYIVSFLRYKKFHKI